MADREIRLRISAQDDTAAVFRKVQDAMGRTEQAADRMGQAATRSGGLFSKLGADMQGALAGITIGAAVTAISQLRDLGDTVGDVRALFMEMGGAGEAGLAQLRGATRGFISDLDLMRGASKLNMLGMATDIGEAATVLGRATSLGLLQGIEDSGAAIESYVNTINMQSTRGLGRLGINVQEFKARVDELTASGMEAGAAWKQAFDEAADALIGRMGPALDQQIGAWDRVGARIQNAIQGIGEFVANSLDIGAGLVEQVGQIGTALSGITADAFEDTAQRIQDAKDLSILAAQEVSAAWEREGNRAWSGGASGSFGAGRVRAGGAGGAGSPEIDPLAAMLAAADESFNRRTGSVPRSSTAYAVEFAALGLSLVGIEDAEQRINEYIVTRARLQFEEVQLNDDMVRATMARVQAELDLNAGMRDRITIQEALRLGEERQSRLNAQQELDAARKASWLTASLWQRNEWIRAGSLDDQATGRQSAAAYAGMIANMQAVEAQAARRGQSGALDDLLTAQQYDAAWAGVLGGREAGGLVSQLDTLVTSLDALSQQDVFSEDDVARAQSLAESTASTVELMEAANERGFISDAALESYRGMADYAEDMAGSVKAAYEHWEGIRGTIAGILGVTGPTTPEERALAEIGRVVGEAMPEGPQRDAFLRTIAMQTGQTNEQSEFWNSTIVPQLAALGERDPNAAAAAAERARARMDRLGEGGWQAGEFGALQNEFFSGALTGWRGTGDGPTITVEPGDSWSRIAQSLGISMQELQAANPELMSMGRGLWPGDVMKTRAGGGLEPALYDTTFGPLNARPGGLKPIDWSQPGPMPWGPLPLSTMLHMGYSAGAGYTPWGALPTLGQSKTDSQNPFTFDIFTDPMETSDQAARAAQHEFIRGGMNPETMFDTEASGLFAQQMDDASTATDNMATDMEVIGEVMEPTAASAEKMAGSLEKSEMKTRIIRDHLREVSGVHDVTFNFRETNFARLPPLLIELIDARILAVMKGGGGKAPGADARAG